MKKMSIIALLLVAVLVTSSSVSGTYAKYTSTFEGNTDSARVAKWSFKINNSAVTNTFNFDLFNTVNDTDTTAGSETDVKEGTGETIIAPGTKGSFNIKLENASEVEAAYTIDYTVTNSNNIPVEFSIDGTNWTTSLVDVTTPVRVNMGGQANVTIQWRWAFTGAASENYTSTQTDVTDTTLGTNGTATISVKADVTVTQID